MTQTVIEIIKQHIIDNGFDGLYSERFGCACEVDDLNPCESDISECKPGYKHQSNIEGYDFCITDEK